VNELCSVSNEGYIQTEEGDETRTSTYIYNKFNTSKKHPD
jgi:hypothetical protein